MLLRPVPAPQFRREVGEVVGQRAGDVFGVRGPPARPGRGRLPPSNSRSIDRAAALSAASGTVRTTPPASRNRPYHLRLSAVVFTAPGSVDRHRLPASGWPGGRTCRVVVFLNSEATAGGSGRGVVRVV